MYRVDPAAWFSHRELAHCPPHFELMKRPLTPEIKQWVFDSLVGRFSVVDHCTDSAVGYTLSGSYGYIAFEDPMEATVYALKW